MFWQYLIPQHGLSRIMGYLSRCETPWLKNWLIRAFIKRYQVDMSLALEPNPEKYHCFNDFFTRALQSEIRPIAADKNGIVSPVDGCVSQIGNIEKGRIFQAKNQAFSVLELLGGSEKRAAPFLRGQFATLYLSPKDYHRVHMPYTGRLQEMIYIPGKLFSVNQKSVEQIPRLFARNERVVTLFQTDFGPMAVILVGAVIVASIETVWAGVVAPGGSDIKTWEYRDSIISPQKGAEMGRFQSGSTVIVLFPENAVQWKKEMMPDKAVIMGQELGLIRSS